MMDTSVDPALSGLRRHNRTDTQGFALGCWMLAFQAKRTRRAAFTLFELILAIALGATLLALIGTAINLYLMRVDADRTRVEEAQLARSVLAMITDDIRGTTVYQKQDTAAIAQLMAAGTPFDVDSIDQARQAMSKAGGSVGGTGGTAGTGAAGSAGSASSLSGSSGGSSSGASSSSGKSSEEPEETMPLGLNGAATEVYVDVTRLPRQEELFATVTGYTNAPSAASGTNPGGTGAATTGADVNPPADLKTVHYYVRQGNMAEPGSAAVTSLAPAAQAGVGGLVRQEVSRRERLFAEQTGAGAEINGGEVLVAPEVTQIQFRYYDGTQLVDLWDMKEQKKLPMAIEVSVWLRSARAATAANAGPTDTINASRVYRQVVSLPMAACSEANAASEMASAANSTTGGESTGSSTSSTGSGTSGGSSAFGEQ